MQIAALLRRNPDLVRAPIRPEEIGGLARCLNADGELRTLPGHLQNESARLSGLDGFFAARLVRR
jgi:16S rRNA (cytosine967-C5)-methyltransferase